MCYLLLAAGCWLLDAACQHLCMSMYVCTVCTVRTVQVHICTYASRACTQYKFKQQKVKSGRFLLASG